MGVLMKTTSEPNGLRVCGAFEREPRAKKVKIFLEVMVLCSLFIQWQKWWWWCNLVPKNQIVGIILLPFQGWVSHLLFAFAIKHKIEASLLWEQKSLIKKRTKVVVRFLQKRCSYHPNYLKLNKDYILNMYVDGLFLQSKTMYYVLFSIETGKYNLQNDIRLESIFATIGHHEWLKN